MANSAESVKQIVDYLDKNLKKGYSLESLRWALVNQKHSRIEIEKAIKIVEARTPSVEKEEQKKEEIKMATEEFVMPEKKKGFFRKLFSKD
jgi:hypothetical protein